MRVLFDSIFLDSCTRRAYCKTLSAATFGWEHEIRCFRRVQRYQPLWVANRQNYKHLHFHPAFWDFRFEAALHTGDHMNAHDIFTLRQHRKNFEAASELAAAEKAIGSHMSLCGSNVRSYINVHAFEWTLRFPPLWKRRPINMFWSLQQNTNVKPRCKKERPKTFIWPRVFDQGWRSSFPLSVQNNLVMQV